MDNILTEEAKELKRKYHREWQRANKEKVKEYNNRYWLKKAEVLKDQEA